MSVISPPRPRLAGRPIERPILGGFVCLLVALVLLHAAPVAAQSATPVRGTPTIDVATIAQLLTGRNSPLAPFAADIYNAGLAAGIDPGFAMAIWLKESEWGTTGASTETRNMGNLICAAATQPPAIGCRGRWAVYAAWPDAIGDWYAYVARRYLAQGLTTVEAIIPVYAPLGDGDNNPAQYIQQVIDWMREWAGGTLPPALPPGGSPGGSHMWDDWIYAAMDRAQYTVQLWVATVLWDLDRSMLWVTATLEQARELIVTGGLLPALEQFGTTLDPYLKPLLVLGLTLWLLTVIAQPIIQIRLVQVRTLFVLVMLAPLLLTSLPQWFETLETERRALGATLYENVFAGVDFGNLTAPPANGTLSEVWLEDGEIPPFAADAETGLHGIDVAAAYLFAAEVDVFTPAAPTALPVKFVTTFFPTDATEFPTSNAVQRADAIKKAGSGCARLAYGVLLVVFAFVETLTHLLFTLGLGFLILGLLLTMVLGWFAPVSHLLISLGHQVVRLLVASLIFSAISAVVISLVFAAARTGSAAAVLGFGVVGLAVLATLLLNTNKITGAALTALAGASSGGAVGEGEAAGTLSTVGRGAARVLGGGLVMGGAPLRGLQRGVRGGGEAAWAYRSARSAGAGRGYAAGFALSNSPAMTQLGGLAMVMGKLDSARGMGRGLVTGGVAGRGEPVSLRGQHVLRADTGRLAEERDAQRLALRTLAVARMNKSKLQRIQQAQQIGWQLKMQHRRQQRAQAGQPKVYP